MKKSQTIPPPVGFTADEAWQYRRDMEILAKDPRTAGNANRPKWLVDRVLADARAKTLQLIPVVR